MGTLRDGIARYRKAYLQLNRAITKYFDININASDIKIKGMLLARGWKPAEVSSYRKWAKAAVQFLSLNHPLH
jgi:hypothetical protein